jgi:hypothetical protein
MVTEYEKYVPILRERTPVIRVVIASICEEESK